MRNTKVKHILKTKLLTHLICHDHDLSVTQTLEGFWVAVVFLVLKPKNLNDVVDFSIFHNLMRKNKQFLFLSLAKLLYRQIILNMFLSE